MKFKRLLEVLSDLIIRTIVLNVEGILGNWLRFYYYKRKLNKIDGYATFGVGVDISGCDKISIGKNCCFNRGVIIAATKQINIGDNVMVGPYCVFRDADHGFISMAVPMREQPRTTAPIIIGNDVWIGAHTVILKGSDIGDHSIVGANSLVKDKLGEECIYVGSPVRLLRVRE
jgi:acetyltransferase-like isoleucine patch superfamily enzyme